MTVMTIRLPEQKHHRLKAMAESRNMSVNKLIEEATTTLLAEFDAETRFRIRASRGDVERGKALLDKVLSTNIDI